MNCNTKLIFACPKHPKIGEGPRHLGREEGCTFSAKSLGTFSRDSKETVKSNADQEVGLELCYLIPNIRCIYICRYKGGNPRTHREVSKILPVDNTSRPEPCRTKPSMLRTLNRAANALDDCRDIEAGGLRAQEPPQGWCRKGTTLPQKHHFCYVSHLVTKGLPASHQPR